MASAKVGRPVGQATILVVEDDPALRDVLDEHLARLGYRVVTAASAEVALALVEQTAPDLILTDVHMGVMSGIELCARLKGDPRFQLTPVILLTGVADLDARVAGLAAGADDFFAKPVEFTELRTRVAALLRVKSLLDQLERAEGVITTLGLTIEARDPYTGGHCERLARYAVALGQALGVDQPTLKALRLAGYLHDLGKIAVPDGILLKPGPLDPVERTRIQAHPAVGADLVQALRTLDGVRPVIRHHHERWDGSGYPDGLKGDGIPLGARIMAVVDVYDALHSERPYKGPLAHAEAVSILLRETDAGFWDSRITATFVEVLEDLGPVAGRPASS
ncbi:MAG: response regulator [Candidatus Rokubacteria bacterium]|nr:response regulator [Candidatus Rokubacteria bacterium]